MKKFLMLGLVLGAFLVLPLTGVFASAEEVHEPAVIAEGVMNADTEVIHEENSHAESSGHGASAVTFLWIAVILLIAKISGLVEKFGQPAVLGELVVGVILGNLVLAGITIFEPIKTDSIITFLAELGVVILLFQIGLESNIKEMSKVGGKAAMVAILGVVVPFVLGAYVVGPLLLPGIGQHAYLFLGAALTATSVGITARVFKDLGKLKIPEAQIILGAAVIDDVLGLIILAVISALVTVGAVSFGLISLIIGKAILFLIGSIVLGQVLAPKISQLFAKIQTGVGMKFTIVISFGLIFSYIAGLIGLAPIVGAFAAGLVLDAVQFKYFRKPKICDDLESSMTDETSSVTRACIEGVMRNHEEKHIEDIIEPIAFLVVPIFFVVTGMAVKLETMFDPKILGVALAVTAVAFAGKLVTGLAAGKVNKWIVGWGMAPRGEVGLIFATIGLSLGVVSDEVFSVIVIMVILTTLLTPPILNFLLKRQEKSKA